MTPTRAEPPETPPAAQADLGKGGHRPWDGVPRPARQGKVPQAAGEPRKQRTQEECRFEAQAGSYDATKGRAAEDAAVDDGDEGAERARAALIGCGTQGVFLAGNGGRGIEYCRHAAIGRAHV